MKKIVLILLFILVSAPFGLCETCSQEKYFFGTFIVNSPESPENTSIEEVFFDYNTMGVKAITWEVKRTSLVYLLGTFEMPKLNSGMLITEVYSIDLERQQLDSLVYKKITHIADKQSVITFTFSLFSLTPGPHKYRIKIQSLHNVNCRSLIVDEQIDNKVIEKQINNKIIDTTALMVKEYTKPAISKLTKDLQLLKKEVKRNKEGTVLWLKQLKTDIDFQGHLKGF